MFKITYKDLTLHRLKLNTKISRTPPKFDNTISIVGTTQGANKNNGININFHVLLFLEYPFVNIFPIGNRIYFEPTTDYINGYKITINSNSAPVTKVSSIENYDIIAKFEGQHEAVYTYLDGKALFYIEIKGEKS